MEPVEAAGTVRLEGPHMRCKQEAGWALGGMFTAEAGA